MKVNFWIGVCEFVMGFCLFALGFTLALFLVRLGVIKILCGG